MNEVKKVLVKEETDYLYRKKVNIKNNSFKVTYKSKRTAIARIPIHKTICGKYNCDSGIVKMELKIINGFSSLLENAVFALFVFMILLISGHKYNVGINTICLVTLLIFIGTFSLSYLLSNFTSEGMDQEKKLLSYIVNLLKLTKKK